MHQARAVASTRTRQHVVVGSHRYGAQGQMGDNARPSRADNVGSAAAQLAHWLP